MCCPLPYTRIGDGGQRSARRECGVEVYCLFELLLSLLHRDVCLECSHLLRIHILAVRHEHDTGGNEEEKSKVGPECAELFLALDAVNGCEG